MGEGFAHQSLRLSAGSGDNANTTGGGSHNWAAAFDAALPPTPGSPAQRNKSMRPKLHSLPDVELAGVLACSTRLSRQFRNKTLMVHLSVRRMASAFHWTEKCFDNSTS